MHNFYFLLGCLSTWMTACIPQESKHRKIFYKNFNYITLQPIGASYDTLTQIPYVKVDTTQERYLHIEIVNGAFSEEYRYEKYEKGWLIRDTCCESKDFQFDLYDGSKRISYRYRGNPYQDEFFNLVTVVLTKADYSEDIYLFGLYNDSQTLPNFDFRVDTSKYVGKRAIRYLHRKDTFWKINSDFSRQTGQMKRDTFCFLKKVPFEFFYRLYTEPYFKQLVK